MKIVFVTPSLKLGGAEGVIIKVAQGFLKRGYEVSIISLTDKEKKIPIKHERLTLHIIHEKSPYIGLFKCIRLIDFSKTDILLASNTLINGFFGFLKIFGLNKAITIGRESSSIYLRFKGMKLFLYKTAYILGYRGLDLIIYQTEQMKRILNKKFKPSLFWKNTIVISNPFVFPVESDKWVLELPSKKTYILAIGRLIDEKGFDLLIESYSELQLFHINLYIIGDGPEKERLNMLIEQKGLTKNVFLLGYKNPPYKYIEQAHACILSSRVEGFPNTLLEMMAYNGRVASTLCAGDIDKIPKVLTCEAGNSHELAELIKRTMKISDEEAKENRNVFDNHLKQRSVDKFIDELFTKLTVCVES